MDLDYDDYEDFDDPIISGTSSSSGIGCLGIIILCLFLLALI